MCSDRSDEVVEESCYTSGVYTTRPCYADYTGPLHKETVICSQMVRCTVGGIFRTLLRSIAIELCGMITMGPCPVADRVERVR